MGPQLTLVLPIDHSTVKLVEEYSCNMDSLIKRLKIDKKTGSLFIKDFKRPSATNTKRAQSADGIAESMNVSMSQQQSPIQGPAVPQTVQKNKQDSPSKDNLQRSQSGAKNQKNYAVYQ